jgi:hypothetical protein
MYEGITHMDFLTQDTPVWLTVGLFLCSIAITMLTVAYAMDIDEEEDSVDADAGESQTVERILFPTNNRN